MKTKKDDKLRDIFNTCRSIAVLGMSRSMKNPSNWIPVYMSTKNFRIVPINPKAGRIKGWKSYAGVMDVPGRIEILQIFRPPDDALDIVREAVERKKKKGDVSVIWLQESKKDEARELAESEGITFIHGLCMYREYKRLMLKHDQ